MTAALRELERIQGEFGAGVAERKLALLKQLERARLGSARAVHRYHEALCFLRAYPDDERVLSEVERQLAGFDERADLKRFAIELQDSGIAGTEAYYLFFAEMASWLVRRFPERVTVAWDDFEEDERLERFLQLLLPFSEGSAMEEWSFPVRKWCEQLKGPSETDAAFILKRFGALQIDSFLREWLYQDMQLPLCLAPGSDTPARGRAKLDLAPVRFQTGALDRERPQIERAVREEPHAVRELSPQDGARAIDLAREAMLTRSRDLDVFSYGDPSDVRLIDWGDGLCFAAIGALPERRLLLEAVYGFLTLKNGVPIGYVLNSALFGSAEIAYNVFETFRGSEAGLVYGRVLATVRHLFGVDSFTIYPYQLGGQGNEEGLKSGAWWFYEKLGFRPKDEDVQARRERELARLKKRPGARTPVSTLRVLAEANVYWHMARERDDVIGILPLSDVGFPIAQRMASRFGSDRERGEQVSMDEAAELLGLRSLEGWSAGERLWWRRWSPMVLCLQGIAQWSDAEKKALIDVIRAKGGPRESEFVRRFDAHQALRKALRRLALSGAPED
jgi:hypothetical protein